MPPPKNRTTTASDNGDGEAEPPADDPAGDEANDNGEDNGAGQPGDEDDPPADDGGDPGDGGSDPGDGGGQPADDGGNGGGNGGGGSPGDGTPPPPLPGDGDDGNPSPPDPGVGDGPDDPSPPADLPLIDKQTWSPAYLDPEASADSFFATIWLHQPLPDPTPPAKRLKPWFATALAQESAEAGVDWALVLGVLRARGFDSSSMSLDTVRTTADRLVELRAGHRSPPTMVREYGGDEFARERDRAPQLQPRGRPPGARFRLRGGQAKAAAHGAPRQEAEHLRRRPARHRHGPDRRPHPACSCATSPRHTDRSPSRA